MSLLGINLLAPVLFYQNPIDAFQTGNGSTQVDGVPSELNSCGRGFLKLSSKAPAYLYQNQKIIQNTVRVYASLYIMNLKSLSAYQKPLNSYQSLEQAGSYYINAPRVNWNQMSDRAKPSVQVVKSGSGTAYGGNSTKYTITRNRPGAMSPGGIGCDIKHNSYDRYLNRLKAKGPLRRGAIPVSPPYVPFDRAFPVFGGKTFKTNIIDRCNCPDLDATYSLEANKRIYGDILNAIQERILSIGYKYSEGEFVWAKKFFNDTIVYKAIIDEIRGDVYNIRFLDDGTKKLVSILELNIYFECDCISTLFLEEKVLLQEYAGKNNRYFDESNTIFCNILNDVAATEIL